MRHVSYRAIARAAAVVAVLVAVPAATVRAQVPLTNPDASVSSGGHKCDKSPVGVSRASALYVECVVNDIDPYSGGPYAATATARVTPGIGGSVHLTTSFSGMSAGGSAFAFGRYPESVRIDPLPGFSLDDIATVFLSSNGTFMAASDVPIDSSTNFPNQVANWAFVEAWGQYSGYQYAQYALISKNGDWPYGTQNFTLQTSMSPGGSNTFFFQMTAYSDIGIGRTDEANVSTDVLIRSPDVQLFGADGRDITPRYTLTFDPAVATIPEPASLVLTLTGLASLAGFARRRRRRAPKANQ